MIPPPPPPAPPPAPLAATSRKKPVWPWIAGGCGCLTLLLIGIIAVALLYHMGKRGNSRAIGTNPAGAVQLPDDYPSDIPIYPGAAVDSANHVLAATAPTDYSVTLTASARLKDVVAFYDRELPAHGWTIGKRSDTATAAVRQGLKQPAKVAVSMFDHKDGTTAIVIGNTTRSTNW